MGYFTKIIFVLYSPDFGTFGSACDRNLLPLILGLFSEIIEGSNCFESSLFMDLFSELSIIIFVAMLVSLLMKYLKQPLIVGYIFTGILVGPYFLNIVQSKSTIELFSKIGITILLFIVGLNLSPQVIKEVGKVSLFTGIGQVLFTSIIGFLISIALGIDRIAAIYVSIALTFSSTIIVLKLLSDKGDVNKLYGKIAIGFLLVQDIVATLILLFATSFGKGEGNIWIVGLETIIKGGLLIGAMMLVSQYILPHIIKFIASSQELLFIFSLSFGLGIATLFTYFGFSVEIGALVAGVSLSMTPYAIEVASRLRPIRDFFILLFFILLGSHMVLDNLGALIVPTIILSLFVLIGNPIIVVIIMNLLGYGKRTSYLAGLTVAQISEFSLILASLGFEFGHIPRETLSLVTLVGLITISGSTYLILYSDHIYPYIEKILGFLEIRKGGKDKTIEKKCNAILFGYNRVGQDFVSALDRLELEFVVVDFNPEAIKKLEAEEIAYKYGDAKDIEFLNELDISSLKYVISTIPDFETNVMLVKKIREVNNKAIVIAISDSVDEAKTLYEIGANYVVMPHYLGASYAVKLIGRAGTSRREFEHHKQRHIEHLSKRFV